VVFLCRAPEIGRIQAPGADLTDEQAVNGRNGRLAQNATSDPDLVSAALAKRPADRSRSGPPIDREAAR
jgi:hypothetical protein